MRIQRKLLDDALTLGILFLATGAFQSFLVDPTDIRVNTAGSTFLQLAWFAAYCGVFFRLIPHYRQIMVSVNANKYLALLVLLAICSITWSQDPALTLRRSVALLATTLIGIDFAVRYSLRDQLRLLCMVLGLVVFLGIVAQVFFPGLIPSADFDSGAWHGVSGFKNDWARMVVLATVAALCWSRRSLRGFLLIASLTIVAFGLIALAHSIGALVILIAMLLLINVFGVLRWRHRTLAIASLASALIVLPVSYLLFQNFDRVTAVLGRDSSLTGRVNIWGLALSSIAKNPIHGYGYSAFWEADSQSALRIREEMNWATPHSHNGYIDMALGLGVVGLLLFLASYLLAARRAIHCFQRGTEREDMWPLAYLCFFFVYQFTEGTLVAGNTIWWILYVAACFSVTEIIVTDQSVSKIENEFAAPIQMFPIDQEQA